MAARIRQGNGTGANRGNGETSPQKFAVERDGRQDKADESDNLADTSLRNALGVMRTQKVTGQSAGRHDSRFGPMNQAGETEPDCRDQVYQRAKKCLERIHFV